MSAGELPAIAMHEAHLSQVFQNLISNALKYRSKEAPLIHVSAMRQQGWWVFSVADNGIGIDARYADQIFALFKRLHTRSEYPGSGIGLAICQRIVEQYGGRISLEKSAPAKDPPSPSPFPPGSPGEDEGEDAARSAPLNILVVEDNHMDVFVINEVLRESGIQYRLQVVYDGEGARAALGFAGNPETAMVPELILLDLNLPRLSGIDLLSELRASARHRNIPVVIVTSSDSEEDRKAARALNASAYFRKPTSLEDYMELGAVIRDALKP